MMHKLAATLILAWLPLQPFAVAAADGMASFEEIEELRVVAQGMKLTHQEFIDAKLTLPRDKRVD